MPRPILKIHTNEQAATTLTAVQNEEQKKKISAQDKMRIDRLLRKSRSKEYMDAIHRLDAGGHVHNKQKVDEMLQKIKEEFPDIEICDIMLGIVAICYLGTPYEVHTLNITGQIIEHYKSGQTLPGGLEKARSIAMRGGYDFIEVYVDCCRAVSDNGTVSVIPC